MFKTDEKTLISVLNGKKSKRIPCWMMRQAGRYLSEYKKLREKSLNFINFCLNPEYASEACLQPMRRFDLDATIVFSDILIVPHALGCDVDFEDGPKMSIIDNDRALSRLSFDRFEKKSSPVGETVIRLSEEFINTEKSVIGFCGSPWTVACYMVDGKGVRDFPKTRFKALKHPVFFSELITMLVEASIRYLHMQIKNGADVIKLFDSWAGILEEEEFDRWVIDPTKRIIEGVRKLHKGFPVIGFPKGSGFLYKKYAEETGVTAVAFDSQTPLDWVKRSLQPMLPVQGNLDPMILKIGGERLERATDRILEKMTKHPGFIFNLGHGIDKDTPINHVEQLIRHIRNFEEKL